MAFSADTVGLDATWRALPSRGYAYALSGLIGTAPVLTMLLSWVSPGAQISGWQVIVKAFALPVIAVELGVIAVAVAGVGKWAPSGVPRLTLAAAWAFLLLALSTAVFASASPGMAFARTSLWIVHCAFAWSVFRLCEKSALDAGRIVSACLAGFLASCILLILFVSDIGDSSAFGWINELPGFDNIRRGAYFAAPIAGLCIGRFPSATGKGLAFAATVYTLAIAFIFWSGSRGAIPAIGVAFALSLALLPRLRSKKATLTLLAATAAGIFLAWLYSLRTGFAGFWRMFTTSVQDPSLPNSDLTSGRTDLWSSTWQTILQRPLFGYGEGQTAYVVPVGQEMVVFHPHNLLLQVLLAWGLTGTLLLIYLALPIARRALNNARQGRSECIPPFVAMLVLLLYSAVDGTLFHVHAVSIFAACAGMIGFSDPASSVRAAR
jgi:O-antigen ligase